MASIFSDMRIRRTLEDILFPSKKEFVGTRDLAYLKLVLANKEKTVFLASFPNSGYTWAGNVLEFCIMKKSGLNYETGYREGSGRLILRHCKNLALFTPADSRSRNSRKIRDMFPATDIDYCLHTHGTWKHSPLWGLDSARSFLIVRNIPATLFSFFMKQIQFIKYENGFLSFLERGNLAEIVRFYNSWHQFMQKKGVQCRIFKYEDLRRTPHAKFAEIFEYVFRETIDPEILSEALAYFSFDRQKQIQFDMEKNESLHSLYRGAIDYSDEIPVECMGLIRSEIKKNLKYDFGYPS